MSSFASREFEGDVAAAAVREAFYAEHPLEDGDGGATSFLLGLRVQVTPVEQRVDPDVSCGHLVSSHPESIPFAIALVPPNNILTDPTKFFHSRSTPIERLDVYNLDPSTEQPIRMSKLSRKNKCPGAKHHHVDGPPQLHGRRWPNHREEINLDQLVALAHHAHMTRQELTLTPSDKILHVFQRFMDIPPQHFASLDEIVTMFQPILQGHQKTLIPITPTTLASLSTGLSAVGWQYEKLKQEWYSEFETTMNWTPMEKDPLLLEDADGTPENVWHTQRLRDLLMLVKHGKGAVIPALVKVFLGHPHVRFLFVDTGSAKNDQKYVLTGLFGNTPANPTEEKTVRFKLHGLEHILLASTTSAGQCTPATRKGALGEHAVVWSCTVDNSPGTHLLSMMGNTTTHMVEVLVAGYRVGPLADITLSVNNHTLALGEQFASSSPIRVPLWNDHVGTHDSQSSPPLTTTFVLPNTEVVYLSEEEEAIKNAALSVLLQESLGHDSEKIPSASEGKSPFALSNTTVNPFDVVRHWKMHHDMSAQRQAAEETLTGEALLERLHEIVTQYQLPYDTFRTFTASVARVLECRVDFDKSNQALPTTKDTPLVKEQSCWHKTRKRLFDHHTTFLNNRLLQELPESTPPVSVSTGRRPQMLRLSSVN